MRLIPLKIVDLQGDGYHILTEIKIFGQFFHIVVDTGASKTVLDKNTLTEIGITEEQFEDTNILSTGLGTNSMQSYMLDLPSLEIGEWKKRSFKVAVLDLSSINFAYSQMGLPPVIGVLGGDILVSYKAIINYNASSMQLSVRRSKSKKPAFDMKS